MDVFTDEYFMAKALELALQAFDDEEVPIGAIVVHENKIIGKGYNQTERLQDVTAHAEMLAVTAALPSDPTMATSRMIPAASNRNRYLL